MVEKLDFERWMYFYKDLTLKEYRDLSASMKLQLEIEHDEYLERL